MAKAPLIVACLTSQPEFLSTIAEALRPNYPVLEVRRATDVQTLQRNGNGAAPNILIVDGRNGSAFREHAHAFGERLPTIVVADSIASTRRRSVRNGNALIDWCRPADLDGALLAHIVHHLLERRQLAEALAAAQSTLQERSIRDDLTGVHNKRHFLDLLTQAEKKVHRYKTGVSLCVVDCDQFREFNSARGFQTGDRVLMELAVVIQQTVREIDVVARFDADEFAVLLPEAGEADARKIAERIRQAVEHYRAAVDGTATIPSVSIGVATMDVACRTAAQLLETAEAGLAHAKRHGGNMVTVGTSRSDQPEHLKIDQQTLQTLKQDVADFTALAKRDYFDGLHRLFTALAVYKRHCQSHAERVAFYAERLASKLGLPEDEQAAIRRGALLHDIGLAVQNEQLLLREGPLSAAERAMIEQHPILGVQLLDASAFFRQELTIILHHHERMDGTGYPDHLTGNHIPLYARIVAITEAWDRMVEPQPYRPALPLDQALAELRANAGRQFDPDLVHTFCHMVAG